MCALINSAVPGACPNPHRHWRKPPSHSQTIAFKYLGVKPVSNNKITIIIIIDNVFSQVFSEIDFRETTLQIPQEQKFINYLLTLQQAIIKLNSKTELHPQTTCSPHYIARGMGLVTGTQNKNTTFFIYSTTKSSLTKDIDITIRGPYSSYATVTIPAFHNANLKQSNNKRLIVGGKTRKSFLKSISMDFMGLEKDDVIPIQIEMESDRAVVRFIANYTGMYQIVLTSNGEHLAGSPYNLRILRDDCDECNVNKKIDDDFEYKFVNKTKEIVIPDCGYRFNFNENSTKFSVKMAETKQIFEIKQTETKEVFMKQTKQLLFVDKTNDSQRTNDNLDTPKIEMADEERLKQTKNCGLNKTKQTELEKQKTIDANMYFVDKKHEIPSEKNISTLCDNHSVAEVNESEEAEIELSTFSINQENIVEREIQSTKCDFQNETPKPPRKTIKAFIKEKKDYWDRLILTNLETKTKENRPVFTSKSMEMLNRKFDFDFSFDKSFLDDVEIPSVRERKSVLIEQLTDEQKLLQIQNEKKLKDFESKRGKPKRWESFNSVFHNGKC